MIIMKYKEEKDMRYDERTGREINDNEFEKDVVASIYDNNGDYYLIGKDKKIYLKRDEENIEEITDDRKKSEILELFKPGKTDVVF